MQLPLLPLLLWSQFPGDVFAQPGPAPLRVRQSVTDLNPNGPEIAALKAGVAAMVKRTNINTDDPLGWRGQALIHQEFCPHRNFFFLPWHRAYLYHFEQLCREASGNPNFVLPYWDWSTDRELPAVFWGNMNPLFHAGRSISSTSQASVFSVGTSIIKGVLQGSNFTNIASGRPNPLQQRRSATSGTLEGTPHNYIHGWVGGDMLTFMSPLDPCFWLHHANIDRIWEEWTERHPNATIQDADWRNWNFANNFVDPTGALLPTVTVESMLSTYDLGYRYNTQSPLSPGNPGIASPLPQPMLVASVANNAMLTGAIPLSTNVDLAADLRSRISEVAESSLSDLWEKKKQSPSVILTIEGITPPKDQNVIIRVFVNCSYLSRETPAHDPHYVGSIAFFEHSGHGDHGTATNHPDDNSRSYSFDLTRTIQTLASVNAYQADQPIEVQLLPVPIHGEGLYTEDISLKGYKVSYIETPAK